MENTLVCLIAGTRAHQLTFPSFKRQVLDELNGDLALALTIDEKYDYTNRFWQHAKYRWTAPVFSDYGEAFDLAQRWLCQQHNVPAPDWRSMLRIKGIWQGRIQSPDPQRSNSSIGFFCRWLLLHGLQQDSVLDRYDRFVLTRSDFVWLCPHPPLSMLDRGAIWLPDGEHYGGINDRHVVVSRKDVVDLLNIVSDIVLQPTKLYDEMKHQPTWNSEQFLAHHFDRKGLLQKVKLFPYVMYLARTVDDASPTWTPGSYEPAVGHYVKYRNEFRSAHGYATLIRSRMDWENGAWKQFDPSSATARPISLPRRLCYAWERAYHESGTKILSALRRPGRAGRFVRFCKRRLFPPPRQPAEIDYSQVLFPGLSRQAREAEPLEPSWSAAARVEDR
jgi:hypothetical protein